MDAAEVGAFIDAVRAIDSDARAGVSTSVRRRPAVAEALERVVALGGGMTANRLSEQALVTHLQEEARRLAVELHYDLYPEDRPSRAQVAAVALEREDDPLAGRPALLEQAEALLTATAEPSVAEVIAAARGLAGRDVA